MINFIASAVYVLVQAAAAAVLALIVLAVLFLVGIDVERPGLLIGAAVGTSAAISIYKRFLPN